MEPIRISAQFLVVSSWLKKRKSSEERKEERAQSQILSSYLQLKTKN
jgi:hypothetical protein